MQPSSSRRPKRKIRLSSVHTVHTVTSTTMITGEPMVTYNNRFSIGQEEDIGPLKGKFAEIASKFHQLRARSMRRNGNQRGENTAFNKAINWITAEAANDTSSASSSDTSADGLEDGRRSDSVLENHSQVHSIRVPEKSLISSPHAHDNENLSHHRTGPQIEELLTSDEDEVEEKDEAVADVDVDDKQDDPESEDEEAAAESSSDDDEVEEKDAAVAEVVDDKQEDPESENEAAVESSSDDDENEEADDGESEHEKEESESKDEFVDAEPVVKPKEKSLVEKEEPAAEPMDEQVDEEQNDSSSDEEQDEEDDNLIDDLSRITDEAPEMNGDSDLESDDDDDDEENKNVAEEPVASSSSDEEEQEEEVEVSEPAVNEKSQNVSHERRSSRRSNTSNSRRSASQIEMDAAEQSIAHPEAQNDYEQDDVAEDMIVDEPAEVTAAEKSASQSQSLERSVRSARASTSRHEPLDNEDNCASESMNETMPVPVKERSVAKRNSSTERQSPPKKAKKTTKAAPRPRKPKEKENWSPDPAFAHLLERTMVQEDAPARRYPKRQRVQPLEFWRNQRIKYGRDSTGTCFKVVGIDDGFPGYDSKQKKKRKKGATSTATRSNQSERRRPDIMNLSIHAAHFDSENMKNNKFAKKLQKDKHLVTSLKDVNFNPSSVSPDVEIALTHKVGNFSRGMLKLKPFATKTRQQTVVPTTIFSVLHGVVAFTVNENPPVVLKTGGSLELQNKTWYAIENLRNDESILTFAIIRSN